MNFPLFWAVFVGVLAAKVVEWLLSAAVATFRNPKKTESIKEFRAKMHR